MSLIQFTQCLIVSKFQLLHLSHLNLTHPPPFPKHIQPITKLFLTLITFENLWVNISLMVHLYHNSICWISTYMHYYCNRVPRYSKLFNSGGTTFEQSGGLYLGQFDRGFLSMSFSQWWSYALVFTGQPRKITPTSVWMKSHVSMETMWNYSFNYVFNLVTPVPHVEILLMRHLPILKTQSEYWFLVFPFYHQDLNDSETGLHDNLPLLHWIQYSLSFMHLNLHCFISISCKKEYMGIKFSKSQHWHPMIK